MKHVVALPFNITRGSSLAEPDSHGQRSTIQSRWSSFQAKMPRMWSIDVAHNAAQEPTLYYSGPIFIGGPLKAYWAKGESLGPDTFVRKSPRDHNYL